MSKIFRLSILIILLLLLPLTGCGNDSKQVQPVNPNIDEQQGYQETTNPNIDEQEQPETANSNIDEPIDNVSDFLGDIGKSYETLRKEHPNAKLAVYGKSPDYYRDDAVTIPEDIGEDAALLTLLDPRVLYAYCLFGSQDSELLRMPVEFFDQIRCQGITTTVGFLFPQVSGSMPIQDFFSMINVVEYEDLFYLEYCFPGWLYFKYKGMRAYMSARNGGNIEGPLSTIKSTYRITLENSDIARQNMKVIDDYADLLNSLMRKTP